MRKEDNQDIIYLLIGFVMGIIGGYIIMKYSC